MQMTMAEKREFLERMQELVKNNILRKEDRDAVLQGCPPKNNRGKELSITGAGIKSRRAR